jgi:hypothetical protein
MLTEIQVALIGIVATGVLWGLKMWNAAGGEEISSGVLKWILFVLSVGMSIFFALPVLPAFPVLAGDPSAISTAIVVWLGAVINMGATVLGFATLVYAVLTKGVLGNAVKRKFLAARARQTNQGKAK